MILWLSHAQAEALVDHARRDAPNEACGVIIGRAGDNGVLRALRLLPIVNTAAEPQHTYYMDERGLAAALLRTDRDGLALVGLYHSHPAGDAIPSSTDIKTAAYPKVPYVIIGLRHDTAELAAWRITEDQIESVELHVGDEMPTVEPTKFSVAQRTAMLISAALIFMLVIAMSLALLPPAPELLR